MSACAPEAHDLRDAHILAGSRHPRQAQRELVMLVYLGLPESLARTTPPFFESRDRDALSASSLRGPET